MQLVHAKRYRKFCSALALLCLYKLNHMIRKKLHTHYSSCSSKLGTRKIFHASFYNTRYEGDAHPASSLITKKKSPQNVQGCRLNSTSQAYFLVRFVKNLIWISCDYNVIRVYSRFFVWWDECASFWVQNSEEIKIVSMPIGFNKTVIRFMITLLKPLDTFWLSVWNNS